MAFPVVQTYSLKFCFYLQIIGAVILGFVFWDSYYFTLGDRRIFFMLTAVTFCIGTFCLLSYCLVTKTANSKYFCEVFYHSVAFVIYLTATGLLLDLAIQYWDRPDYRSAYIPTSVWFAKRFENSPLNILSVVDFGNNRLSAVSVQCNTRQTVLSKNLNQNGLERNGN